MKTENPKSEEIESKEPEKLKKSFWQFFSHPAFNLIGLILAVLGFIFGFYFYYAAKVYPQLVVYNHPVKANIVKVGQASDLKTFYKDKEINSDVAATQVAIWNQGNASIKKEQILKPIVLFTDNNVPILEATIRKSTRGEVTKITLNQDELQNGRLTVSWNILEQNDGGVIQIIYAGDSRTNINIEGAIEGQKEVDKLVSFAKIQSGDEQYISAKKSTNLVGMIFSIYAVLTLSGIIFYKYNLGEKIDAMTRNRLSIINANNQENLTLSIMVILFLLSLAMGIYYLFLTGDVVPPFDF